MNSQDLRSRPISPAGADAAPHLAGLAAAMPVRTISSAAIFRGGMEIGIEHHGEIYRLKITRQGKLILTK